MNETIRMQLSAYVDGELPESETELLLRRLSQDATLRAELAEFLEIGRRMRSEPTMPGIHALRGRIAAALDETVLPGLEQHTVTSRLLTPIDFRDRLFSYKGAAFGLQPILMQTAWFRPHNRSEDIEGLYLVGAGTHPGAGLPGVISSAKVLDEVVPDPAEVA